MPADHPAATPLPLPRQPPAVSRAKAHAILSQRQFRGARPSLFEQFLRWVGQHLGLGANRLLSGGPGAALGWMVLLVAVGIVVALVVYGTRTLRRDAERAEPVIQVELRRSPADWVDQAERHERGGDWKEGLRCRYRALVAGLIAAHAVRDLPGRTTGEHRADVRATVPDAEADFAGASELFERAWYGDRFTGPDERDRFVQLAESVLGKARHANAVPDPAPEDHELELVAR